MKVGQFIFNVCGKIKILKNLISNNIINANPTSSHAVACLNFIQFRNQSSSANKFIDSQALSIDGCDWTEISIPVPWGHISGKTYGDPKNSPVLIVHGIMDNSGTFDTLIPLLSKSLFFVAIDLPGHGLSSHIPAGFPYTYIDMVIAVRRVTNHFEWTKFSWLGHSMGAGLGAFFASTFPTHENRYKYLREQTNNRTLSNLETEACAKSPLVDRVVMIDLVFPLTGVRGENYPTKVSVSIDNFLTTEGKTTIPPSYDMKDAIKRLIAGTNNELTEETAKILLKRGATKVSDNKYAFSRDFRLGKPPNWILGLSDEKCFEILSGLRSPVLFIKAKQNEWYCEPELVQRALKLYKEKCPVFQYEEVDENHFVHLNKPKKIAPIVNKFLLEKL